MVRETHQGTMCYSTTWFYIYIYIYIYMREREREMEINLTVCRDENMKKQNIQRMYWFIYYYMPMFKFFFLIKPGWCLKVILK